jgi:hypothetical protein
MTTTPARPRRRAPFASRLAIVVGLGALVAAPLLPVEPAEAAGCAPGWTQVRPYINTSTGFPGGPTSECELVVTESGNVTIPAGVGKIDVLVVGGGGGGGGGTLYPQDALCNQSLGANSDCTQSNFSWAGGGGGGGVEVCKALELSGTVSVTVGDGGTGAVAATYPGVTPPIAGDGEATTVDSCTTPGGKGGGSSVSIGGVRQNGSGGASGNGNAGSQANVVNFSDAGGGGGGAAEQGGFSSFTSGGEGKRATGGCFTGFSRVEWGGGGGGAPAGNNLYWSFDEESESSQVWISGATVNNSYSGGTPAKAGPANSGMGGGGGLQTPPYKGSDAILRDPIAYSGGDGGSGVVILRYTLAGAPVINSFFPAGGPPEGGSEIRIFGSGFACGPEVTIGGEPCLSLEVRSETEIVCNSSPAGADSADIVVTATAGTSTSPTPYCYGDSTGAACGGDGGGDGGGGSGGGDGDGDGAGAGDGTGAEDVALVGTGTGRTALPATGLDSLLVFAGTASVVLGSSAMAIGARRRRSNTSD